MLLDGFPSTAAEASALEAALGAAGPRLVLHLDLGRAEAEARLKAKGGDDGKLGVLMSRFEKGQQKVQALLEHYAGGGAVKRLDASQSAEAVCALARALLTEAAASPTAEAVQEGKAAPKIVLPEEGRVEGPSHPPPRLQPKPRFAQRIILSGICHFICVVRA